MRAVKNIKKKIKVLEAEVIEMMFDGEDIKNADSKLEQIATLKVEATKVHLKCISDTIKTLTEEQMELLFPFWDS